MPDVLSMAERLIADRCEKISTPKASEAASAKLQPSGNNYNYDLVVDVHSKNKSILNPGKTG
jgi:hypothetical protein